MVFQEVRVENVKQKESEEGWEGYSQLPKLKTNSTGTRQLKTAIEPKNCVDK